MRGKPIYRDGAELVVRWPSKSELAAAETKNNDKLVNRSSSYPVNDEKTNLEDRLMGDE